MKRIKVYFNSSRASDLTFDCQSLTQAINEKVIPFLQRYQIAVNMDTIKHALGSMEYLTDNYIDSLKDGITALPLKMQSDVLRDERDTFTTELKKITSGARYSYLVYIDFDNKTCQCTTNEKRIEEACTTYADSERTITAYNRLQAVADAINFAFGDNVPDGWRYMFTVHKDGKMHINTDVPIDIEYIAELECLTNKK